uniref:Uncharacterized protein n=1 Tax=Arundo donax TaxID=35708 RepID=A0A0A9HT77_ARUDO
MTISMTRELSEFAEWQQCGAKLSNRNCKNSRRFQLIASNSSDVLGSKPHSKFNLHYLHMYLDLSYENDICRSVTKISFVVSQLCSILNVCCRRNQRSALFWGMRPDQKYQLFLY